MATATKETREEDSAHVFYGSDFDSVLTRNLVISTVFPRIEAGVSISFVGFLTRPLNEAGLYSREASNSRTRRAPISIIRAVTHSFRVHAILPRSSFYCSIICMAN